MKFAKILIAALAVAMVGCNNTDDNYTPTPELIKVCVDAGTSADTSADTRTEFNGTETTWAAGDQIRVAAFDVTNDAYLTEAVLTTQSTAIAGTFTGEVTEAQYEKIPRGSTYNYVAAYPSSAVIARDGKSVSFAVPATYTATPNSLNGHLFDFMVAAAADCASIAVTNPTNEYPTFGFEHVLAFLEITLTGNDPIKTVKVEAPATICGTVSVDPKGDLTPSVSGGANTITVTLDDTLDADEKLYVPVIPGIEHSGALTITLTCKNGNVHTITKTLNGKTFNRGKVTKVNGIGYAMADDCIALGEVRSYVENNANDAVKDVNGLQVSATLTDNTLKTDEITFYWSASANGAGTAISGTKSVSGQTVTLTAANTDWSDKDIYVWAEVNHNGNLKTTARKQVYVIGEGDVLTTSVYTSYSKYLSGNVSEANGLDAYTIYDAGYSLAKNVPSRIPSSVSSSPTGTLSGQALGEHILSGTATIGGIGGKTFTRTDKVHITGLPYEVSTTFSSLPSGWQGGNYKFKGSGADSSSALRLQGNDKTTQSKNGWIVLPTFYIPQSKSIDVTTTVTNYLYSSLINSTGTIYAAASSGSSPNNSSGGKNKKCRLDYYGQATFDNDQFDFTLSPSNTYVAVYTNNFSTKNGTFVAIYFTVKNVSVKYR